MIDRKNKAIFMDRDGTVSHEVGYINHITRLRPYSYSADAVKLVNNSDFLAILITNQAGVARGYFEEEMVKKVHNLLQEKMEESANSQFDDIFYCPHHPEVGKPPYKQNCNCRKPKPGMILEAAKKHHIDLTKSYMIGDKISDVEMAIKNGLKGILVLSGYGRGEFEFQSNTWKVKPDHIAENLLEAVKWILSQ